jgi:hypothetical protein
VPLIFWIEVVNVILPFGDLIIKLPVYSLSPVKPMPPVGLNPSTAPLFVVTLITFCSPSFNVISEILLNAFALPPSNLKLTVTLSLVKFLISISGPFINEPLPRIDRGKTD